MPKSMPRTEGMRRMNPIATTGPLIRNLLRLIIAPWPQTRQSGFCNGSGGDVFISLTSSPKNKSVEQEQNHRAHDRHDPTGDVILAREGTTDPSADKGAGDSEQYGDDATAGIFSRHQQFRDGADDKADNQCPNNRVSSEVHMGSDSD